MLVIVTPNGIADATTTVFAADIVVELVIVSADAASLTIFAAAVTVAVFAIVELTLDIVLKSPANVDVIAIADAADLGSPSAIVTGKHSHGHGCGKYC